MLMVPSVSIVLSTYNGSNYIKDTITSVLKQTYKDFEFIIVNDASNDNVKEIIMFYKNIDTRIIYIENAINLERSKSRNKAINLAKGKYIAFVDDDDIRDKNKLIKQISTMENNKNIGIIGTGGIKINEKGNFIEDFNVKEGNDEIKNNFLVSNQFIFSSIIVRKQLIYKYGGFNEEINLAEDYDLWLKLGIYTNIGNIPEKLISYRISNQQTTHKKLLKIKWNSLLLTLRYGKYYPNFIFGVFVKIIILILPDNIVINLTKLYKELFSVKI